MKKSHFIIIYLLSATIFAQVSVSTLTAPFNGSGGLSLDDDGNLYIGDFGDFLGIPDPDGLPNHVMKLDTNLNLTQYSTGFVGASGNNFDNNGILFQSDIRANVIYKIIGGIKTFVTSTGIVSPVGIVFDSDDNFYVCNCGDSTIRKVTPSGVSTQFASGNEFSCPNGITVDENDNLYVTNFSNTNIVKITPSGTTSIIGNTSAGNGHLDYDINHRNLYIGSYFGHQIYSLNIDNLNMEVIAGTGVRGNSDGPGSTATFSTPNGVSVSKTGDSIYVNCAVPLTGANINPQIIRLLIFDQLGVDEKENIAKNIKTYPNPTGEKITIEADFTVGYSNLTLTVFDLLGRVVLEQANINTKGNQIRETLDLSKFAMGNYLYSLRKNSKQLFNGKIVKK